MRGTDPAAAAALAYGLSRRAPDRRLHPRRRCRGLITRRPATLAHSGLKALDEPTVRALVRQAGRDVRTAPPPPPADPPADPTLTELRRVVDDLAARTHQVGELILEVAAACLSDTGTADVLAPLCGMWLQTCCDSRDQGVTGDLVAGKAHLSYARSAGA